MKIKELDAASLSPRELNSQVKESAKDYDKILIKILMQCIIWLQE